MQLNGAWVCRPHIVRCALAVTPLMTTAQTCATHCIPFLHSLVVVQIWA